MTFTGRIAAGAIAAGSISFTTAFGFWAGGSNGWLTALTGMAASSLLSLPLAWILGGKYDRLKADSTRDCLTGVHNRGFIESSFPKLLQQAQRKQKKISILMIDVNDFKDVNDRFGHEQGDRALKLIAQSLAACSLKGEIVARWGGDEFVIVCPYGDDKGIDAWIREQHQHLLRLTQRMGFNLSVSVGSACYPEHGSDLFQLVRSADKKMYANKNLRRIHNGPHEALQA
ncbi:GGDEF domain-containing protein [Paenibacillus oenotherae]|uniref:GGDEF domain-containing protein n=1 Tax=Paenibacillus oenotherae TaxID=1435645 RepID=A0ABS7DAJ3_9BACL|nr:GGDEF domain-containing protein [Paenibacillus oenotherae]MBW7476773.1 GGDEF domain-containing protein [Paenibacillus oenotherae]